MLDNMEKIKFGTDGWRSVIADGFTFKNVGRAVQATCDVVKKNSKNRFILIGYDRRFFSDRFAHLAAKICQSNGFKVEISDGPIGSPVLSHATKDRKAALGLMLTASHNPAQFNGFKLKSSNGGSVDEATTKLIENQIENIDEIKQDVESRVKTVDFVPKYISFLKKYVKPAVVQNLKQPVIFDAMHGPGGDIFEKMIGSDSKKIQIIRKERDPLFGGGTPEPIEIHLDQLKETVLNSKAAAGFAVDGDADRIGVIDDKGRYIPPHTVMPLILLHLLENKKLKGKVVQTVSMGYLPGRIAEKFKVPHEEVCVGFKYIAEKILNEKVCFGGEESGGYGVGAWSPERDGILCALLLLEYMAKKKKLLSELVDELYENYGASHFKRIDFSLAEPVNKVEWSGRIKAALKEKLGAHLIKKIIDIDGIKIVLEDDSWVLMRPSGTEPLIRTYAEGPSENIVKELLVEADRLVHLPPPRPEGKKSSKPKKRPRRVAKANS